MDSRESNHVLTLLRWLNHWDSPFISILEQTLLHLTQPARHSLVLITAADLTRSKSELIAENAFLRQQLIVLLSYTKTPYAFDLHRFAADIQSLERF
jgi:hypothetical protein